MNTEGNINSYLENAASPSGIDEFVPVRILDLDIANPIPDIAPTSRNNGRTYQQCRILVRLHKQPIGVVDLAIGPDGLAGIEAAASIWTNLSPDIRAHLSADGCPPPSYLHNRGIICSIQPKCQQEIELFLETAPPASIVIATHNRTDSLAETLNSVVDLSYPNFEVIIVDNAPDSDETADFLRRNYLNRFPIKYICVDYPGLAVAHNAGLLEVSTPYVAFTDDDVMLDRYWLAHLINRLTSSDRVACVTGMIFPYELETAAQEWIEQYGGFSKGFQPRIFDNQEHRLDNPLFPFAAGWFGSGANMAFRTDYLKKVGGFDPATGAGTPAQGGDDLSAFFQVINSGYQLVYEPRSLLFHKHRRDYLGLQRQAYGYGVGLAAYLTKIIIDKPQRLLTMAARFPSGLAYIFSSKSKKNIKKSGGYPKELNRLELKGMLHGPIAYIRSRRKARKAGLYLLGQDGDTGTELEQNQEPKERARQAC